MKNQKSSRVDLLEKKIQALIGVVQQLLDENAYLKDLAVGTLETIKCMPDYDEAIEKLKDQVAKDSSETKETEPLEKTSD
jgi:hypothetical protein